MNHRRLSTKFHLNVLGKVLLGQKYYNTEENIMAIVTAKIPVMCVLGIPDLMQIHTTPWRSHCW